MWYHKICGHRGKGIGHYTVICQQSNRIWEEFDGLVKKKNIRRIKEQEIIPAIFFYKL